ncbi:MAG: zinc ribbon domain-containing protein [Lachnospiraceae bacterium]|nr:zinc ribbon domain-containing protein [Lachnospiraceae bacterium]
MYLNKVRYYVLKVIAFFGTYFWGIMSFIFIFAICISLIQGEYDELLENGENYFTLTAIFTATYIVHILLGKKIARATIYNSLFSNDPDGIIQMQVLERAMGIERSEILKDMETLHKLKLFEHMRVEMLGQGDARIVLTNAAVGERRTTEKIVYCRNCGAKNSIRTGFVKSCSYCGSQLYE